jgi:hypothetical protein
MLKETTIGDNLRLIVKITAMKYFLIIVCLLGLSFVSQAQSSSEGPKYFAQCMLNIDDEQTFRNLEQSLRDNPYVGVVRLDWISRRAFLLTKDLTSFSVEQFQSWLGEEASQATCIQVGLHGIDPIAPYPFTNCEND